MDWAQEECWALRELCPGQEVRLGWAMREPVEGPWEPWPVSRNSGDLEEQGPGPGLALPEASEGGSSVGFLMD